MPPRRECAPLWRARVLAALPRVELMLLVGSYAQRWHLPESRRASMTDVVHGWRELNERPGVPRPGVPRLVPLPHPSWRNNAWIKRNPWFESELLPVLRAQVRELIGDDPTAGGSLMGDHGARKRP